MFQGLGDVAGAVVRVGLPEREGCEGAAEGRGDVALTAFVLCEPFALKRLREQIENGCVYEWPKWFHDVERERIALFAVCVEPEERPTLAESLM